MNDVYRKLPGQARDLLVNGVVRAQLRGPFETPVKGKPVLLIHGLSAASNTFEGNDSGVGLAHYLADSGYDVWLLDWRGTGDPKVQAKIRATVDADVNPADFSLDAVAEHDHPAALDAINERYAREGLSPSIAVVAHCVGAATFAMTATLGLADNVDRIVLLTIGLFFKLRVTRQLIVQDHILEERTSTELASTWLDQFDEALTTWPERLRESYAFWERARFWPVQLSPDVEDLHFKRTSFLYGEPFAYELVKRIRGTTLQRFFGPVNLGLLQHACENARCGVAVQRTSGRADADAYLDASGLRGKRITLITGHRNLLWHRDSIDRMYEWLLNEGLRDDLVTKHILHRYAHQDLLWSASAVNDVFPLIRAGLRQNQDAL